MRPSAKAALAVAGMFVAFEPVNAGQLNMPTEPQSAIQHIKFETPTLAPFASAIRTNVAPGRFFAEGRFA